MSGPSWAGAAITGSLRPRSARGPLQALLICLVAALLAPAAANGQAIQEFPVPAGSFPGGITTGPDGNLWFTAEGTGQVGRMTPGGAVTMFPVTTPSPGVPTDVGFVAPVDQIISGPDGALWFTMPRESQIGHMTTGGALINRYTLPPPLDRPEGLTVGPDGAIWFTAVGIGKIGRITTGGTFAPASGYPSGPGTAGSGLSDITSGPDGRVWFTAQVGNQIGALDPGTGFISSYSGGLTPASEPSGITPGPGGGLWFTESAANQIGQISTGGSITEYPGAQPGPSAIAAGRDGALWFTASEANSIGRIATSGAITNHFPLPTAPGEPSDITTGPDGALWFTQLQGQKIGRIDSATPGTTTQLPPIKPLLPKKKKAKACKVPKVRGLGVKKAKKKLRKAKCKFKVKGKGYVVRTKPGSGKRTTKRVQVTAKPRVAKSSSREGNRP
jgi:streptogramin lyase